ncbi:MAG: 50S ribosomal protein L3 [Candidatus Dadabacteria bacterium]|nr:50S ribosomal protein L3 [Candidatus Dadabacteria bacterium]
MIEGLIGKKKGMTELFLETGEVIPTTVIEAGPCYVVDKKTEQRDGYESVQLGFAEIKPQRSNKAMSGVFKKAGVPPLDLLKEFKVLNNDSDKYNTGDVVSADIFSEGDYLDVTSVSKGKGFSGAMKRHGFSGQRDSHGGMAHRRVGAIGQASFPAKVWKGQKMPGHYGAKKFTIQGLKVVKVDIENNLVLVKGSVPGPNGSHIFLKHTVKGRA